MTAMLESRRMGILNEKDENLVGFLYEKSDTEALIIVCHGFNSDMNDPIVEKICELLKKKYNVFQFNFSGYGNEEKNECSKGNREDSTFTKQCSDLKSVIDYFFSKGYKIKSVIGHSTGGTATILRAAKDKRIESIVLIAPRIYPSMSTMARKIEGKYCKTLNELITDPKVIYPVEVEIGGKLQRFSKTYVKELATLEVIDKLKRIMCPILILHGDKDKIVDIEEGKAAEVANKSFATFFPIIDADHNFSGEYFNEALRIISSWLIQKKLCSKLWFQKTKANLCFEYRYSLLCPTIKKGFLVFFTLVFMLIIVYPSILVFLCEYLLLEDSFDEGEKTYAAIWWAILTLVSMLTLYYVQFINRLKEMLLTIMKKTWNFENEKKLRDVSWKQVFLSYTVFFMFITISALTVRIFYMYTKYGPSFTCPQQFLLYIDRVILYSFCQSTILRILVFFDSYWDQLLIYPFLYRRRKKKHPYR